MEPENHWVVGEKKSVPKLKVHFQVPCGSLLLRVSQTRSTRYGCIALHSPGAPEFGAAARTGVWPTNR